MRLSNIFLPSVSRVIEDQYNINILRNNTSDEDIMMQITTSILNSAINPLLKTSAIQSYLTSDGLKKAPDEIPPELVSMLFWLVVIMIIILSILIIFIILFIIMMKRQAKLNYPVKTKRIIRKERMLLASTAPLASGTKGKEIPLAKPAREVLKSSKEATVTPIRITSILSKESESESDTEDSEKKSDSEKSKSGSKPIAKPVRSSDSKSESKDDLKKKD